MANYAFLLTSSAAVGVFRTCQLPCACTVSIDGYILEQDIRTTLVASPMLGRLRWCWRFLHRTECNWIKIQRSKDVPEHRPFLHRIMQSVYAVYMYVVSLAYSLKHSGEQCQEKLLPDSFAIRKKSSEGITAIFTTTQIVLNGTFNCGEEA